MKIEKWPKVEASVGGKGSGGWPSVEPKCGPAGNLRDSAKTATLKRNNPLDGKAFNKARGQGF